MRSRTTGWWDSRCCWGGLRHREQHYNLQGANAYLNVIIALAVLGLVLPDFTSTTGPTFSTAQAAFSAVTCPTWGQILN